VIQQPPTAIFLPLSANSIFSKGIPSELSRNGRRFALCAALVRKRTGFAGKPSPVHLIVSQLPQPLVLFPPPEAADYPPPPPPPNLLASPHYHRHWTGKRGKRLASQQSIQHIKERSPLCKKLCIKLSTSIRTP
jgi:hypothetical protein